MAKTKRVASEIVEKAVKDRVRKILREYAAYWFMPVQSGYGAPSLDFLVCHHGRFLGIETKRPGKKPTPRQLNTMADIHAAGGHTLVIGEEYYQETDTFSGEAELKAWLLLRP